MRLVVSGCARVVVTNPYLIGKSGRVQDVVREQRGEGWPREENFQGASPIAPQPIDETISNPEGENRIRDLPHGDYYCRAESVGQETVSNSQKGVGQVSDLIDARL